MPDATNRVLKEQSMVVRHTETRDFGLATGWSEEDGTTTTYQPFARAVGRHRRIETGPVPRTIQQRSPAPASLYARRPSGVQPKVSTPALDEFELIELDELDLQGNPFAPRRSAASASVWNTLGFAALFASVLIGRVIVDASQEHARTGVKQVRAPEAPPPSAAAAHTGSAGIGSDAQRNAAALDPASAAREGSPEPADAAPAGGSVIEATRPSNHGGNSADPAERARDSQPAAAEPSIRVRAAHPSLSRTARTDPNEPARAGSSDWRDGPMEPATSSFAPPTAASGAPGTLRINSRPWSQVFIDGRLIGNTPQMSVSVPAGSYSVRLSNPELGMSKTFTVHVGAGELVTRVESLE